MEDEEKDWSWNLLEDMGTDACSQQLAVSPLVHGLPLTHQFPIV